MLKKNVFIAVVSLLGLVLAISCQEESVTENNEDTLSGTSTLTNLLTAMAVNETANGNVIDSTDCFNIQLPVQVTANGQQLLVATESDYDTVTAIFNESNTDNDHIELVFPLTIVYPDYSQMAVSSQEQYDSLIAACNWNPQTISNNCIALNFPITIFGYNSSFQVENTYVLANNAELYAMLTNMGADEYYSLNFPVMLTVSGQDEVTVNSNSQLIQVINDAVTACSQPPGCQNPGVLTDNLVFYMPFSNNVADLKGSAVIAPADTTFVADRNGNAKCALLFNGNYQLHIPATGNNILIQGDPVSISLWFRMDDEDGSNLEQFFAKGTGNSQAFTLAAYDNNTPMFFSGAANIWDMDWNADATLLQDHNWHHLVLTLDTANTLKLYRDGILRNTVTASGAAISTQAMDYYIGNGFHGALDDLRVYRKVLNQQEVQTLFELEGDCNTCLE